MFGFLKANQKSITMQQAQAELLKDRAIILIDVRMADEYIQGHIPGSMNIPLNSIQDIKTKVPDKSARIFVHCLSGARSQRACGILNTLGYTDVTNIGGINSWRGKIERG
ncbi:MAG: hypothetical protein K0R90_1117 [Oscillospiraceae bacterium]|jgi:rhodanese-related sulfurtransferase|nr:hypothetical protein [Oscillospiraceae bacterium]